MATVKSNKARGPVRISEEAAPGTNKTANPHRKDPNVAQGPRSGNSGTVSKQKSFLEEKSDRNSRFSQLADMVMAGFGKRGAGMKPHIEPAVEPVADKVNVGRRKK
ncbi:hypothetical protein UFOVP849_21 [uncultured Caudovirales phage]|uniref:Uncharacterized protein n=1 Tax=uncultured Caudovirales phage TaxID=2100421 RepID=A0A6J5P872_9CAUD|nr:hypothetical protein UFOVP849_21 [uncultured Caudovirales phage]